MDVLTQDFHKVEVQTFLLIKYILGKCLIQLGGQDRL